MPGNKEEDVLRKNESKLKVSASMSTVATSVAVLPPRSPHDLNDLLKGKTNRTPGEEGDEGEEGSRTGTAGESGGEKVSQGSPPLPTAISEPQMEDIVGPGYNHKFRPAVVQYWVEKVIKNVLADRSYVPEEVKDWTNEISKEILSCVHLLKFPRYKVIVTVVIAERSNDALVSGYRCIWDAEADCSTTYTFTNDTMYCVGTVHGVYCY